jgi:hypothetical protein
MLSVFRLLLLGVSIWLFTGLVALTSCWGALGAGFGSSGGGGGSGGVLRVLSNAVNAKSHLADPSDALLSSAHGLRALRDAGVLSDGDDTARLALRLVDDLLVSARRAVPAMPSAGRAGGGGGGAGAGGGAAAAIAAPSPSVNPKKALRLKKLGKFAKVEGAEGERDGMGDPKSEVPPKNMHYTHQKCYIGNDEAEVRVCARARACAHERGQAPQSPLASPPLLAHASPPLPHPHLRPARTRACCALMACRPWW